MVINPILDLISAQDYNCFKSASRIGFLIHIYERFESLLIFVNLEAGNLKTLVKG